MKPIENLTVAMCEELYREAEASIGPGLSRFRTLDIYLKNQYGAYLKEVLGPVPLPGKTRRLSYILCFYARCNKAARQNRTFFLLKYAQYL